jgi:DNA-binding winged helix-turn-helix (wHTH) protein/tetratricopeptide (TPR) repeat protein
VIFEFDNCVLDTATQELRRAGEPVHVEPQVLAVLAYLAEHSDRMVTKIELLDEVWGDRFVSESALTSRIKLARKACGDSGREQRILRTVHSRGYRFVATVNACDDREPADRSEHTTAAEPSDSEPSDSVRAEPVAPTRASTTMFGRDPELRILHDAAADVSAGVRRSVFVCGGLGIGKSTLVAEFLEQAEVADDWVLARGQCIRARGGVEPYFCLLDALSSLARTEQALVAETLERVAPSWLSQLPQLLDRDASERLERRLLGSSPSRMLREGAEAFGTLAQRRPLVLVLEDLHWSDDCTLDVIDLLLQRTDPARLLLIGVGRPDTADIRSVIDPAAASGRVTVIELEPLDGVDIDALAADRLGGELPEDLLSIIQRRSGGVPLFAEEIVTSWLRNGQVEVVDATVRAVDDADSLEATIPPTLPPLIERELRTLADEELTVLEACAVAGDTFAAATVAAALDRPTVETEEVLASLARRRGLIGATGAAAWPDGTVSAAYAFTQQLFHEVIYDRIPTSRRNLLHGRAGDALEAGHGARAGELALVLADHFSQAGEPLRASRHLCVAGKLANSRNAPTHAVTILTGALDTLAGLAPSPERDAAELQVRMAIGPALVATRGWFDPSVSDNYERALQLCDKASMSAEAAAARYGLATVSELRGQFERTEALLTPLLMSDTEGHLALEAHELIACSTFHQGAFERSLRTSRAVLESWDEDAYSVLMARIAEHPASSCSSWSSLALWALGRSDESMELAERAVELGDQNRYALSTAVQQRAMLHQLRNEPEACIEWADRCRQVGEDQDYPMRTIQADIYKGWALAAIGRTNEGVALIDEGLTRFRDAGATLNEAYYLGMYADALMHRGDPERALELLDLAVERSTSRTYFYEAELRRLRARCLLGSGNVADARDALDEALTIADRQEAPALELRILVDRLELESAHGDPTRWRDLLATVLQVYDDQRPVPDVDHARRLLAG